MGLQKYKIYVNGIPVFLCSSSQEAENKVVPDKNNLVAHYIGKRKLIKQYLDLLDKNHAVASLIIYGPDVTALWEDFQSCFKILEAAGGYVLNAQKQLLVFFRRGSWDMPKGKIDPGETPEMAAVREVQEETGLSAVDLGDFLLHTWHTYEHKGNRILKKTWWYRMQTTQIDVTPQVEEDIEAIRWVVPDAWLAAEKAVYGSIKDVIEAGLQK
jgi:8-oxo-dGTP pyrophosphatase MutT (NUDIX family)